jgi:hypothetical protein
MRKIPPVEPVSDEPDARAGAPDHFEKQRMPELQKLKTAGDKKHCYGNGNDRFLPGEYQENNEAPEYFVKNGRAIQVAPHMPGTGVILESESGRNGDGDQEKDEETGFYCMHNLAKAVFLGAFRYQGSTVRKEGVQETGFRGSGKRFTFLNPEH